MSDNAFALIFATAFVLGLFTLIGWVAWLDSPRRSPSGGTPKETPKVPPKGGLPPGSGHQPTRTANTASPPKGGSAVTPPKRGEQ